AVEAIVERGGNRGGSDCGSVTARIRPRPKKRKQPERPPLAGWPGGVASPRCAMKTPDTISEKRLEQLREQAALGRIDANGIRPSGSPMPETPSYYGLPIVKPPV